MRSRPCPCADRMPRAATAEPVAIMNPRRVTDGALLMSIICLRLCGSHHFLETECHLDLFPGLVLFLRQESVGLALQYGALGALGHRHRNRPRRPANGDDR